jgi:hypothetical protein
MTKNFEFPPKYNPYFIHSGLYLFSFFIILVLLFTSGLFLTYYLSHIALAKQTEVKIIYKYERKGHRKNWIDWKFKAINENTSKPIIINYRQRDIIKPRHLKIGDKITFYHFGDIANFKTSMIDNKPSFFLITLPFFLLMLGLTFRAYNFASLALDRKKHFKNLLLTQFKAASKSHIKD